MYEEILHKIEGDERYQSGIKYGSPRRGHAEGSVENHITELKANLTALGDAGQLDDAEQYYKLLILVLIHDTFKGKTAESGNKNCAIEDPNSHASLAAKFLSEFVQDEDLIRMVQYHDIGYAVYRNFKTTGRVNEKRLEEAVGPIKDKNLFLLFCVIDSCTVSKGREMIAWFIGWMRQRYVDVEVPGKILGLLPMPQAEAGVF